MFEKPVTEDRWFVVLVRVDPKDGVQAVTWMMKQLKSISGADHRLAFSSQSGETFGVFLRAKRAAAQIRAMLDKQYTKGDRTFVMVVELGDDWAALGNSRAWEWLQHHKPTAK